MHVSAMSGQNASRKQQLRAMITSYFKCCNATQSLIAVTSGELVRIALILAIDRNSVPAGAAYRAHRAARALIFVPGGDLCWLVHITMQSKYLVDGFNLNRFSDLFLCTSPSQHAIYNNATHAGIN